MKRTKLKLWMIPAGFILVPVLFLLWLQVRYYTINAIVYPWERPELLSMEGRTVLLERGDALYTYKWSNGKGIETKIPNSDTHGIVEYQQYYINGKSDGTMIRPFRVNTSSVILRDGAVIWNSVSTTTSEYALWKYEGGVTTKIVSLPLLDLYDYQRKFESGEVDNIEDIRGETVYAYSGQLTKYSNNSFGFLELQPIEHDGSRITKLALNTRVYDINGNLIRIVRERDK